MIKIKFETFTKTLEKLENTSSQNEMVETLAETFKGLGEDEIGEVCYLVLGKIGPGYEDVNLGLSEKTVQSAISLASGYDKALVGEEIRNLGDIGEVASKMLKDSEKKFKKLLEYKKSHL